MTVCIDHPAFTTAWSMVLLYSLITVKTTDSLPSL